ncbi:uncharacterized protein [Euwallacea similis]|uniref:uncharacterized protein n=1 Tax=Euwallacea similis TaxID=1736056 RepID=UPI00344B324D
MTRIVWVLQLISFVWAYPLQNPFQFVYPLAYPSSTAYLDYNYHGQPLIAPPIQLDISRHNNDQYLQNNVLTGFPQASLPQPTLNIMAELPYTISKQFSVIPMFIVPKDALNLASKASIERPVMMIKSKINGSIECTPAVRMVLERPILVGSLKSDILFPSEVQIINEGIKIPIKIGAVVAPVISETAVSPEAPLSIRVVYAVPTKPIKITITIEQLNDKPENVENTDAVVVPAQEAVVVESESELPPKNVTVTDFPKDEAEPTLVVGGEDVELVNRNPPLFLVPAGIVSSSQPIIHEQIFHNDKESPLLEGLRDPSKIKKK